MRCAAGRLLHRTSSGLFCLVGGAGPQCSLLFFLSRQIFRILGICLLTIFRFRQDLVLLAAVGGGLLTALLSLLLNIFFGLFGIVGRLVSTGCQAQYQ